MKNTIFYWETLKENETVVSKENLKIINIDLTFSKNCSSTNIAGANFQNKNLEHYMVLNKGNLTSKNSRNP